MKNMYETLIYFWNIYPRLLKGCFLFAGHGMLYDEWGKIRIWPKIRQDLAAKIFKCNIEVILPPSPSNMLETLK